MTDAKNQQAEPSMEEILASIRRIISEDTEAGKTPPATPGAASTSAPTAAAGTSGQGPDVLELTEMVGEDGKVTNLNEPEPERKPEPAPAVPAAKSPEPPAPANEAPSEDENLVSPQAATAAVGALSGLAAATRSRESEPPRASLALGNGAATLEEMVRAEMRPILKAWLDEHLAPMVERLVQKEIKRITRQIEET